jgi:urea transporter
MTTLITPQSIPKLTQPFSHVTGALLLASQELSGIPYQELKQQSWTLMQPSAAAQ